MEVLIGSEAIQGRVREIGRQIARDHPEGAPLLIGVLRDGLSDEGLAGSRPAGDPDEESPALRVLGQG